MAGCSLCDVTFQCRAQTVKSHGNSHQKRGTWLRKQKDKADWQARFAKAAEYTALQRAGQTADPQLHTLFASVSSTCA
eukprot:1156368-Pelagomonas_calceolata.AAC.7